MSSSNQSPWWWICNNIIVLLAILTFPQLLHAAIPGVSSSELIVDQNGKVNYQIPITVPPGTAKMQPTLALNYSNSGNGLIGLDWKLSGLTTITRCSAKKIRDGFFGGINFDANDRFCINGQRLIAIDGIYGANGTEYRTEIDNFTKVISYGNQDSGPAYFKVWTKSGQILEYGNTEDSRIEVQGQDHVRIWAVNKISDTASNYQTIRYLENNSEGSFMPDTIHYTGNSQTNLAPNAKVQFIYEARYDETSAYSTGSFVQLNQRMSHIKTYVGPVLVKDYRLTYNGNGPANQSYLVQLQECDGSSQCLPAIFLEHDDAAAELNSLAEPTRWALGGEGVANPYYVAWLYTNPAYSGLSDLYYSWQAWTNSGTLADVNNDGLLDAVTFSGARVYVLVNNGNSLTEKSLWSDDFADIHSMDWVLGANTFKIADVNGDGRADLVGFGVEAGNGQPQQIHVALSTGSSFAPATFWGTRFGGLVSENLIDINADGLPDVVKFIHNGVQVSLNTGHSFRAAQYWTSQFGSNHWDSTKHPRQFVDVNADGLPDIVGFGSSGVYVALNTGSAFSDYSLWTDQFGYNSGWQLQEGDEYFDNSVHFEKHPRRLIDVNNDGLPDIVGFFNNEVMVALNLGGSFAASTVWIEGFGFDHYWITANSRQLVDMNSDGLPDIVAFGETCDSCSIEEFGPYREAPFSNHIIVSLNSGTSFLPPVRWANEIGDGPRSYDDAVRKIVDINGDGLPDAVGFADSGIYVALNINKPRLLKSITDGLGTQTTLSYKSLIDNSVYSKGSGGPGINVAKGSYVVSSIKTNNGIGGQSETSYTYNGLRVSRVYGLLGFASQTAVNHDSGIKTTTYFNQNYPLVGHKINIQQHLADESKISETSISYNTIKTHDGTETVASHIGTIFTYPSTTIQNNYDINDQLMRSITTQNSNYDNYGHPQSVRVTTTSQNLHGNEESYLSQTTDSYNNDTNHWYLGQLTRRVITKTLPDGDNESRVISFGYHTQTGLLTSKIVEPDNASLRLITDYDHDDYGNIISTTISGGNGETAIIPRTDTAHYDSRGQFITKMGNALGHETQYIYEPYFGQLQTFAALNNLVTFWSYDSFGRNETEIRPDNTKTTSSIEWCDGFNNETGNSNCPAGAVLASTTETDGSPTIVAYSDVLGRTIQDATVGRNGRIIYSKINYNSRGLIAQKSLPYFDGDPILWRHSDYDDLGREYEKIAPDGTISHLSFNGLSTTHNNALNQQMVTHKNGLGQVVKVTDAALGDTYYRYDAFGNLIETEDNEGNRIRNTFDLRGNKETLSDPDNGNWHYRYNALGELISQTNGNNETITMHYDVLGRLQNRQAQSGKKESHTWLYDGAEHGIGKLYATVGYADEELPAGGTISIWRDVTLFHYDELSRPSQTERHNNQILGNTKSFRTITEYDDYSRIRRITYPKSTQYANGLEVDYTYSTVADSGVAGYLTAVSNTANGYAYWQAKTENAAGQLTEIELGNGITTHHAYSATTGKIETIQSASFGATNDIQNLAFSFDAIGNLKQRTDYNQYSGVTALTETFHYDELNRMQDSTVLGQATTDYHYDSLGNLTFKTGVGTYSYGTNAGPHAVTQTDLNGILTGYTYDANGNMMSGNGRTITYDSFGKPVQITSASENIRYTYGVDRSRMTRINMTAGTLRYYVGNLFEYEFSAGAESFSHFIKVVGNTTIAIETTKSSGDHRINYLHKDHLGSIIAITDHMGLMITTQSYDPHGKRRNSDWTDISGTIPPPTTTDRGFTGHEHIDTVGLIHMNGRVYDSYLGRFIAADPFIQAPLNSQSFNRYSYVMNNPLSLTDPSGFFWFDGDDHEGDFISSLFDAIFDLFGSSNESSTSFSNDGYTQSHSSSYALPQMTVTAPAPRAQGIMPGHVSTAVGSPRVLAASPGLHETNNIWRNNQDPSLIVLINATELILFQTEPFEHGSAEARVTGLDWFVHGTVTILTTDAGIEIKSETYDFLPHGTFFDNPLRNYETRVGYGYATMWGFRNTGIDFTFDFIGEPNVINPYR